MPHGHRYCPDCGAPLARSENPADPQRCAACGATHWRNSVPAVTALLQRGNDVLLSKRARDPHRGTWDFPGGFLEWGEPPREGMARELEEETGCAARVERLVAIAMGTYEGRATMNLVYACELEGEPRASDDAEDLKWFPLDALPPLAFPHEARILAAIARGDELEP